MNINKTAKFVLNLERRKDRLEKITKELNYIGWDYEIFKAIDMNDHRGCSLSHAEIIKIAKERGYSDVMVIEDDCTFMPYSKILSDDISSKYENLEYYINNLAPTLDRPVKVSNEYDLLIDLTDYPEAQPYHRGIFATNCIMYNEKSYDKVLEITVPENLNYIAVDDFIYKNVYLNHQSYCPILPIAPQTKDWSDVSHGEYSNFFSQTYQWNYNGPVIIPAEFMNYENNQLIKDLNIHKKYYYESKNNN
jgi:GR25 family glycosyltransferase involved in LPS biosynthesis